MSATKTSPASLIEGTHAAPETVGPITRVVIAKYAGAGGDFNPIHLDEEFAKAAGMASVFSHGLLTAGLVGQYVAHWVGVANVRKLGVRFTGQVWPEDRLTLNGRVASIEESGGERLASLEVTATRQTGDVVLKATAVARIA